MGDRVIVVASSIGDEMLLAPGTARMQQQRSVHAISIADRASLDPSTLRVARVRKVKIFEIGLESLGTAVNNNMATVSAV